MSTWPRSRDRNYPPAWHLFQCSDGCSICPFVFSPGGPISVPFSLLRNVISSDQTGQDKLSVCLNHSCRSLLQQDCRLSRQALEGGGRSSFSCQTLPSCGGKKHTFFVFVYLFFCPPTKTIISSQLNDASLLETDAEGEYSVFMITREIISLFLWRY